MLFELTSRKWKKSIFIFHYGEELNKKKINKGKCQQSMG